MSIQMSRRELAGYLGPVTTLMVITVVAPLLFIVYQSLGESSFSLEAYRNIFQSALFRRIAWTTFEIALSSALVSIVLAYPIALHLSRLSDRLRPLFMIFVSLPFLTSILVKSFAFTIVLGDTGLVNKMLAAWRLPQLTLLFNRFGVLVGMSSFLIPFVVFPLLANLLAHDANLRKSASVMGASDLRIFWQITFPQSAPALAAGGVMCFVLSMGSFVTPALLGGRQDMMAANLIDFYTREALDWPSACAVAVILSILSGALLWLLGRLRRDNSLI
ncbi:ABC transporter permease [Burkholderia sp. BCC1977]|uniref:ABC transporter permease n=1 Tax=Burkholderia sp. BCC1977 TaxID=2817440 RepID=UPI002ABDF2CE|nr:ABC transporter permease [Burkholderia sp. BCC1977]